MTVLLAAGGTGGHIFPAVALAEKLSKEGHHAVIVTDKRFNQYNIYTGNKRVICVWSASPSGNIFKKLWAVCKLGIGFLQSLFIIKRLKPSLIVGFGGYPSFPLLMAAKLLKRDIVLHEQNAHAGKVNAIAAAYAVKIATSFAQTQGIKEAYLPKVVMTGNPVRTDVQALSALRYPELSEEESLHILVTGGSQGASMFADIMPKAVNLLPEGKRRRLRIDQQCRFNEEIEKVRNIYADIGVQADLSLFFSDIASRLAAVHLVIARSGASTVAELVSAGKPSILVPYMYATDDHQTLNASMLGENEAAIVVAQKDFTPELLAKELESMLDQPQRLSYMAKKVKELATQDAVQALYNVLTEVAGAEPVPKG